MNNLQKHKNELLSYTGNSPYIDRAMQKAIAMFVYKHRFEIKGEDPESLLNWLCEECDEAIKLKLFEKDILYMFASSLKFDDYYFLMALKKKGHFKGIEDTSMKIKDILDNCIIVSDDYEGFDDCK